MARLRSVFGGQCSCCSHLRKYIPLNLRFPESSSFAFRVCIPSAHNMEIHETCSNSKVNNMFHLFFVYAQPVPVVHLGHPLGRDEKGWLLFYSQHHLCLWQSSGRQETPQCVLGSHSVADQSVCCTNTSPLAGWLFSLSTLVIMSS